MKALVRFEHQLLAVESEHQVNCMLELLAPAGPEGQARPPLHLALVIDRSGSMAGPKLEVTRECAAFLVRRLALTDELALITYDGEVQLLAPLAPVDPDVLLPIIASIQPGGQTNLSGGWLKGVEELGRGLGEGPRKVLLLTDGLANVGISDPAALTAMARKTAESAGVGTTTIGFGEGFDEALLTAMADAGRGNAHHAPTPDAAPAIFAGEFEGLMSLVAQNVSVEIRPSEDVQLLGILNGFPQVAVAGGVQMQLGDAYGEERRRVIFQLHIAELATLGVAKVAEVVLRYVTVGEQVAMHETRIPLTVNLVSADEAAAAEADHEVTEEVVILKAARAQTQAREHADRGEFEIARKLLSEAAEELRTTAPGSVQAEELLATAEMLGESFTLMSPADYDPSVRKLMHYESRKMSERRKKREP
ncbi:MAG: VWA domain-containing protein [Actinomycetota bacterium]|nr:VWA domain-containing protein [Actinomycetota bacterium]